MRQDLNKQLCERERHLSTDHYHNYRHDKAFDRQDDDDEPFSGVGSGSRESMSIRYKIAGYGKGLAENLNPLWGLVHKNCGRRWDKFYSELCKVFDKRSVVNQHILDHLFQYVAVDTIFIGDDGKLWVRNNYRAPQLLKGSDQQYYVDPRDGIMKLNAHYVSYKQMNRARAEKDKRERLKTRRVVDDSTELHLIQDVWYEFKFETVEGTTSTVEHKSSYTNRVMYRTSTEYPYRYDVLKKATVAEHRVAVSKRTLSHKELKKHGLLS